MRMVLNWLNSQLYNSNTCMNSFIPSPLLTLSFLCFTIHSVGLSYSHPKKRRFFYRPRGSDSPTRSTALSPFRPSRQSARRAAASSFLVARSLLGLAPTGLPSAIRFADSGFPPVTQSYIPRPSARSVPQSGEAGESSPLRPLFFYLEITYHGY